MLFLVDSKKKILFGWSAKCGCSHIKNIYWFLQTNNINNVIHSANDMNNLPDDIENYTSILIIRNPYKRIVSGFLDKYRKNGEFRKLWKYNNITFSMFVNELEKGNWEMIDRRHFTPQTTESFDIKVLKSKSIKLYDLENIDYNYIEKLYNKKIPEVVLHKKQGHERDQFNKNVDSYVYNVNIDEYYLSNVAIKYFYSQELKNKILKIYKNDFMFFLNNGFDYINSTL